MASGDSVEEHLAELERRLVEAGPVRSRHTRDFGDFVRAASALGDAAFCAAMHRLAAAWSSLPLTADSYEPPLRAALPGRGTAR